MSFIKSLLGFEDAPPPDPLIGEAAKSNAAIGERMQTLAEKQYADQSAALNEYRPLLKDAIAKSTVAQDKATAQSDSAWADYQTTWRPVEQTLATKSLAYSDPARVEQEAQRAAGMAQTQLDRAQRETEMSLAQAGASPEKTAALLAAGRVSGAKSIGAAEYQGRTDAEAKGMAYLDNAARFGRNMTSTGIETARLAGQTGQQVQSGVGGLQSAISAPAQSAAPLLQGAVNANNAAGSLANTGWNQANAGAQSSNDFIGDIIGAGAKAAGMYFGSSKKIKRMGKKVDGASEAVAKSPAKHWSYKPGEGDGSTKPRMGPTAESLADVAPEVSDGKQVDGIAMLGLHHAAIGDQHKRLKKLEQRLSAKEA